MIWAAILDFGGCSEQVLQEDRDLNFAPQRYARFLVSKPVPHRFYIGALARNRGSISFSLTLAKGRDTRPGIEGRP